MKIETVRPITEPDITEVVKLLNEILMTGAERHQYWIPEPVMVNDKLHIGLLDERSKEIKMLYLNPDYLMQRLLSELLTHTWQEIVQIYLKK